jgi:hypothetical protein
VQRAVSGLQSGAEACDQEFTHLTIPEAAESRGAGQPPSFRAFSALKLPIRWSVMLQGLRAVHPLTASVRC